jgi:hypothetical protein
MMRQGFHVDQIAGGCPPEQCQRLVGGDFIRVQNRAEGQLDGWANASVMGNFDGDGGSVRHGDREPGEAGSAAVGLDGGTDARSAVVRASTSRSTSSALGVNKSTSWVGLFTRSWASIAPPPARATSRASGSPKASRMTCSCSGSRLTRRRHPGGGARRVAHAAEATAVATAAVIRVR